MAGFSDLPPEILRIIAQLIYLDHLPRSLFRCIDPHGLPSTYPDGRLISSTQPLTQSALYALCLTSRSCYHAAKPLLWRRLQIRLPYSFVLLLRSLGVSRLAEAYEEQHKALSTTDDESVSKSSAAQDDLVTTPPGKRKADELEKLDFNAMLAAVGLARVSGDSVFATRLVDTEVIGESGRDLELVWKEEDASVGTPTEQRYHVVLAHEVSDNAIHRFPRILDFSTYTTQGMRRTVGQGHDARFVTPAKLLALITAVSKSLMAFGASMSMDSALTLEVLEALLIRARQPERSTGRHKLRGVSVERSTERGKEVEPVNRLEALDLCSCTSARFEEALRKFVDQHLRKSGSRLNSTLIEEEDESAEREVVQAAEQDERRGRPRSRRRNSSQLGVSSSARSTSAQNRQGVSYPAQVAIFPSVERLSLHGIPFPSDIISPFILAFPSLTHLDLTATRIDDDLLDALGSSTDLELQSLSLAKCSRLSSRAITEFIVDSAACAELIELSLEGSVFFPTPITSEDMATIITTAPCMRSGRLRYLDLSACNLTDNTLRKFLPQPALLDVGLSHTSWLSLEVVASFLLQRAPNVQVLELVGSCPELHTPTPNIVRLYSALLEPCTARPPLSIAEQLKRLGLGQSASGPATLEEAVAATSSRTNLRVIGLAEPVLRAVGGALGDWRCIDGKGRRGWLVDVHAGPNPGASDEDIGLTEPDNVQANDAAASTGLARQLSITSTSRERGRAAWRGEPSISFEPETPPRRASRSPSMHRQGSNEGSTRRSDSMNRMLLRRAASQSHSRSRSRQPPVINENPLQTLRDNARRHRAEEADLAKEEPVQRQPHIVRDLPDSHPRVQVLKRLADAHGHVPGPTGWHSKKMEVLLGLGLMGRESGQYAFSAYQA